MILDELICCCIFLNEYLMGEVVKGTHGGNDANGTRQPAFLDKMGDDRHE